MYYHRVIINFKKLRIGNKFFLHILVNIPNKGNDLYVYPMQFSGVFIIAYGMSKVSNIDPDKVYDYHNSFDIKPTQVVYNVDINANNKRILNIALDRNHNSSAATVGMVKELIPFTKNVYSLYFEQIFDFTDANNYIFKGRSSGIIISAIYYYYNRSLNIIRIPYRNLNDIKKEGLNINNYTLLLFIPVLILQILLYVLFFIIGVIEILL